MLRSDGRRKANRRRSSMQRLSPQDASFLHLEDAVTHMHIGSVAIMEGPPPSSDAVARMVRAHLPSVPRYRQRVHFPPLALGRPVWVDDPALQPRLPPAAHGPARARRRRGAAQPGGAGHVPAARPLEAAVGDLDDRAPAAKAAGRCSARCTTAWSTACPRRSCCRWCSTPSASRTSLPRRLAGRAPAPRGGARRPRARRARAHPPRRRALGTALAAPVPPRPPSTPCAGCSR